MDGAVQQAPQPRRHKGGAMEALIMEFATVESTGLMMRILIGMSVGVEDNGTQTFDSSLIELPLATSKPHFNRK